MGLEPEVVVYAAIRPVLTHSSSATQTEELNKLYLEWVAAEGEPGDAAR